MDLAVEGVGCAGCIRKIEGGLKRLPGVVEARLNFTNRRLAVDWRENELARRRRDRGAGETSAIAPIRSSPSAPKPRRRVTRAG